MYRRVISAYSRDLLWRVLTQLPGRRKGALSGIVSDKAIFRQLRTIPYGTRCFGA